MEKYSHLSLKYSSYPAKVYSALHREQKIKYIVKLVKHHSQKDGLLEQVSIHYSLKHPNIVRLKEYFDWVEEGIPYTALVLEYCAGGTIENLLIEDDDLNQFQLYSRMLQIAQGVQYLHQQSIIHRDIKPQNILISRGRPKISDFGSAIKLQDTLLKQVGTRFYESPEMEDPSSTYGLPTDVWSLGIVFLEILLGERIYRLLEGMRPPCKRKSFPKQDLLDRISSKEASKLVKHMLARDPSKRYSIDKVVQKMKSIVKLSKKGNVFQLKQLEISMNQEDVIDGMLLPHKEQNWIYRVDPSREDKIKTYKIQAGREEDQKYTEVVIKYNDAREQLWINCEGWSVYFTYETLPYYFRYFFLDMYDLVLAMRSNHNFMNFEESTRIIFTLEWRVEDEMCIFEQMKMKYNSQQRMRRIDYKKHINTLSQEQYQRYKHSMGGGTRVIRQTPSKIIQRQIAQQEERASRQQKQLRALSSQNDNNFSSVSNKTKAPFNFFGLSNPFMPRLPADPNVQNRGSYYNTGFSEKSMDNYGLFNAQLQSFRKQPKGNEKKGTFKSTTASPPVYNSNPESTSPKQKKILEGTSSAVAQKPKQVKERSNKRRQERKETQKSSTSDVGPVADKNNKKEAIIQTPGDKQEQRKDRRERKEKKGESTKRTDKKKDEKESQSIQKVNRQRPEENELPEPKRQSEHQESQRDKSINESTVSPQVLKQESQEYSKQNKQQEAPIINTPKEQINPDESDPEDDFDEPQVPPPPPDYPSAQTNKQSEVNNTREGSGNYSGNKMREEPNDLLGMAGMGGFGGAMQGMPGMGAMGDMMGGMGGVPGSGGLSDLAGMMGNLGMNGFTGSSKDQSMNFGGQKIDMGALCQQLGISREEVPRIKAILGQNGENIGPLLAALQEGGGQQSLLKQQGQQMVQVVLPQLSNIDQMAINNLEELIDSFQSDKGKRSTQISATDQSKKSLRDDESPDDIIRRLKVMERVNGPQKILIPIKYTDLGCSHFKRGSFDESIQAHITANSLFQKNSFYKSDDSAYNLYRLGLAYSAVNEVDKSLDSFEKTYHILVQIDSKNTVLLSKTLNHIGIANLSLKKYKVAEDHFRQSISYIVSKFNDLSSEERKFKADPIANIGYIRLAEGKYDEALKLLSESVSLYQKYPHPRILKPLRGICDVQFSTNNLDNAVNAMETMFKQGFKGTVDSQLQLDLQKWVERVCEDPQMVGVDILSRMLSLLKKNVPEEYTLQAYLDSALCSIQ